MRRRSRKGLSGRCSIAVVLRTIRSLSTFLGHASDDSLDSIQLEYSDEAKDLQEIPKLTSARELAEWAEAQEKRIYAQMDSFAGESSQSVPSSQRLESVLWLQSVRFMRNGSPVAVKRLLMIDDLHRLRRKQREILIDEMTVQRPGIRFGSRCGPLYLETNCSRRAQSPAETFMSTRLRNSGEARKASTSFSPSPRTFSSGECGSRIRWPEHSPSV